MVPRNTNEWYLRAIDGVPMTLRLVLLTICVTSVAQYPWYEYTLVKIPDRVLDTGTGATFDFGIGIYLPGRKFC